MEPDSHGTSTQVAPLPNNERIPASALAGTAGPEILWRIRTACAEAIQQVVCKAQHGCIMTAPPNVVDYVDTQLVGRDHGSIMLPSQKSSAETASCTVLTKEDVC